MWFNVLRRYGWQLHVPAVNDQLADWWLRIRKSVAKARCKNFDSLILQVCRSEFAMASAVIDGIWSRCELWCRAKLVGWSLLVGV
jgi:hypothetical protein